MEAKKNSSRLLTNTAKLRVLLNNAGLVEEGNEWLVGGLYQHELQGITIEGNAFQRFKDRMKESTSCDYINYQI